MTQSDRSKHFLLLSSRTSEARSGTHVYAKIMRVPSFAGMTMKLFRFQKQQKPPGMNGAVLRDRLNDQWGTGVPVKSYVPKKA